MSERIPGALNIPPIRQALEVLTVLTQNDQERERYEARLKAQRDWESFLDEATEKGELMGRIHLCERLLNKPLSPKEHLRALSSAQLEEIAASLEKQALPAAPLPN